MLTFVKITSHFEPVRTWDGDVDIPIDVNGDENVLEWLFRHFNRVDQADVDRLEQMGYRLPSLSVGDQVEIDGKGWKVASLGFERTY